MLHGMSRLFLVVIGAASCTGAIEGREGVGGGVGGGGGLQMPTDNMPPPPEVAAVIQPTALRRLTKAELQSTITDLLYGDAAVKVALAYLNRWPDDSKPFDNDYTRQFASARLVDAAKSLAEDVADAVIGAPALLQKVSGCMTPSAGCLNDFIPKFGQRTLRRPLRPEEIAEIQALTGMEGDFAMQVAVVIRTLLQDPEFLFRVERGIPTAGSNSLRLTGWEIASRLSYLIKGSMPDEALFALAAKDELRTPSQIREAAIMLLQGSVAHERVKRFHAMWLGFDGVLSTGGIGASMRAETNALLERVIFEKQTPWLDLFRSRETYIDDALAKHYGDVPKPNATTPKWTSYGTSKRQGILSHGSFLSVANAPTDTSVTLRGKHVRNELLCQEIQRPPAMLKQDNKVVDTTKPPTPGPNECRIDAIKRTTLRPGSNCIVCHNQMDPIGLGLDNYDQAGKYRTSDQGKTPSQCPIKGEGEVTVDENGMTVVKTFKGAAQLSQFLLDTQQDRLAKCLVTQYVKFASGRALGPEDGPLVDAVNEKFAGGLLFQDLLLAYVSSPGFAYRLAD